MMLDVFAQYIVVNGLSPDITFMSNPDYFKVLITSPVSGFNGFSSINIPTNSN